MRLALLFFIFCSVSSLEDFEVKKPASCGHSSHTRRKRESNGIFEEGGENPHARVPFVRAHTPHPSQVLLNEFHHQRDLVGVATSSTSTLRISPIFITSAMSTLTSAQSSFLQNTLVPSAIAAWQNLLNTVPVSGNLFAHRTCTQVWQTSTFKCASFSSTTYCAKGFDEVDIPMTAYLGTDYYYPTSSNSRVTVSPTGTGVANADFVIFVTACELRVTANPLSGTSLGALYLFRPPSPMHSWHAPTPPPCTHPRTSHSLLKHVHHRDFSSCVRLRL